MIPDELKSNNQSLRISRLLENLNDKHRDNNQEESTPLSPTMGHMIPNEFLRTFKGSNDRPAKKKFKLPNLDADLLVDLMLQHYGYTGQGRTPFSKPRYAPTEIQSLLSYLKDCGYNFPKEAFNTLMLLGREILNQRREYEHNRHMALNNYDFDRLLEEVDRLKTEKGEDIIADNCPTLNQLIKETIDTLDDDYPGRHLPYSHFKGKKSKQYILLRLIDEILYRAKDANGNPLTLNDDEIKYKIYSKVTFAEGIDRPDLAHAFSILSDLLTEEVNGESVSPFVRTSGVRGHAYKSLENDPTKRVTAFMMTISRKEYDAIRRELEKLDPQIDLSRFPLLNALSNRYFENWVKKEDESLTKVYNSTLFTVNYRPSEYKELKEKVKKFIELNICIPIQAEGGIRIYEPVKINENRYGWGLLTIERSQRTIHERFDTWNETLYHILTPAQLMQIFNADPSMESPNDVPVNIGVSPFFDKTPHRVVLKINKEGYEFLKEKKEFSLSKDKLPYWGSSFGDSPIRNATDVEFDVLLNNDFFELLYFMDKQGYLKDIVTDEIRIMYESYYRCVTGKQHRPWNRNKHGQTDNE